MKIEVKYAKAVQMLTLPDGSSTLVRIGQHYPADDPIVQAHPEAFSDDPRYGMNWTGQAPAYMALPPDEGGEAAGSGRGSRRDR